ncbi:TPA: hypothetical protein DEP96_02110 [Candidatus Uhrbacteria bacterium]|nr:hypothetical protein [Candidatus Uhrbacteria bacterium]
MSKHDNGAIHNQESPSETSNELLERAPHRESPKSPEQLAAEGEALREQEKEDREQGRGKLDQLKAIPEPPKARAMVSVVDYIAKNIPDNLKKPGVMATAASALLRTVGYFSEKFGGRKTDGRENVPKDEPYILVANHSRPNDPFVIADIARSPLRIATADIHFKTALSSWFHKAIGMYEVKASLGNLRGPGHEGEVDALLKRVPIHERPYYKSVAERKSSASDVLKFAKETAALLARGDKVAIMPEGLWLYEGEAEGGPHQLRQAYGGIELVAREYQRLTGKDIKILPVAISDRRVRVLPAVTIGEEAYNIHGIMQDIADELPANERGFYGSH